MPAESIMSFEHTVYQDFTSYGMVVCICVSRNGKWPLF